MCQSTDNKSSWRRSQRKNKCHHKGDKVTYAYVPKFLKEYQFLSYKFCTRVFCRISPTFQTAGSNIGAVAVMITAARHDDGMKTNISARKYKTVRIIPHEIIWLIWDFAELYCTTLLETDAVKAFKIENRDSTLVVRFLFRKIFGEVP